MVEIITSSTFSAIMANPRKFSEKIALHAQKQAEGTAAFEAILQEVNSATREPALPAYPQKQQIAPNLGAYRGGSLPNVNQMATNQSIDLQATLQHLDDMKQGRSAIERPHGRQDRHRQTVGPHRRNFPPDKRIDSSPYGSAYHLSPPPDTSWRRVHSDPSLHMNAMDNNSTNYSHQPVTPPSHRRIVEMVGQTAVNNSQMNYWDSKKMGGQSRPKSCEVPNINIYPSQEQENINSPQTIPMTANNTGSLPDLSVLQFPSPMPTPLDSEDQYSATNPGSSPVSLSPTSPHHMVLSPQSPSQRRRQVPGGVAIPSPLVLNQMGGPPSQVSMTQYRNNGVSENCQSPTSPHSAPSYSPVQSPSLPPTTQVNPTFSDAYLIQQQQQQQTTALQHQFEQFNMQNNPQAVNSTTMGSMVLTTNGMCINSSMNNGINSMAFSQQQQQQPDTALQLSQAAMLSFTSADDILQPHFLGPIDVMASGHSNHYSSTSSPTMIRHAAAGGGGGSLQNSISSSPSSSKIPDIVFTSVDDMYRSPLDFAKDIGNAITGLADYFDADLLENEEAFKADLYPLDPEDIQMMTNASLVADPATEDTFKLDRL